ncbi:MAG: SPOR domain-containing protein [Gemmatimonadetes bacterium]|nr:SPOR domain-containing protein [Gemmatimonadota bacterium]
MKATRILGAVLMPILWAGPATAQQDSLMREAVRLASEGQSESARELVQERMDGAQRGDSVYVEALYTAGVISSDVDSARSYFRRVSIEFSRSPWADESLLQLAQLAFGEGNFTAARRLSSRILLDYPFSEVRPDAAYWAGRSEFNLGNAAVACALLNQAEEESAASVELANRIDFYLLRCEALAGTPADTTEEDISSGEAFFAVQVAALRSALSVDAIMRSLQSEGYQPRVSRDSDGFLRVRVGRYASRAAAQRDLRRITSLFGGEPFIVEDR